MGNSNQLRRLQSVTPDSLEIYKFWLSIFAMGFGIGVVTGIVLSFEFGLGFARYAQIAGPAIGPLIALEVLTAFFLEAGFLGIMLFNQNGALRSAVAPVCGGFSMLMGDVITLEQQKLPVKVIVFKNESLAFVELEQKASGFLGFATDLGSPDFAKIAEGSGLLGLTARTPDQVEPMIAQALKHDGPAVVEVFVARHELAMPPTITLEQAKGFSLFTLKAVLNGRGDELIDLAKVNLLR